MILKYSDHGHPYEDVTEENKKLNNRIKELENSLSIALSINDKYQRENVALKKRAQEAEGEVTIVKGIGQNSPEMKALQKEVEGLKAEVARVKEDHQFDNIVHQKELTALQKKFE
jgi:hypothetical protein